MRASGTFEGSLHGRAGAFDYAHAATTTGTNREGEYFTSRRWAVRLIVGQMN